MAEFQRTDAAPRWLLLTRVEHLAISAQHLATDFRLQLANSQPHMPKMWQN